MTIFDGIILGVTLLSALMGLVRGLTREVLGLLSWVGGVSLTFICMPFVQIIARRYIQNGMMADVAAAVGLFVIFLILFSMISHVLTGFIKDSILGGIDRSLGFLFGVSRAIVIFCVFQLMVSCFIPRHKYPIDFQHNRFAPMIYKGGDLIMSLLPHQIAVKIYEQQQKNMTDAVGGELSGAAAGMINGGVLNGALNGAVNSGLMNGLNIPTPAHLAQNAKQPITAQQEAENLARLRPMQTPSAQDEVTITQKQKSDLDRYLNLNDVDEEGAIEAEGQQGPGQSSGQISGQSLGQQPNQYPPQQPIHDAPPSYMTSPGVSQGLLPSQVQRSPQGYAAQR